MVAIESYVGPRPEHASEALAPLIAELEALGVTARPESVYARARDRGRPPGVSNPAVTLPGLIEQINKATDLLQKRSYRAAADQFEAALVDAYSTPRSPNGYASLAAAGAMAATAGYLFYRGAHPRPPSEQTTVSIAPARSGVFLTATGGF